jgi:hypothetical protein
MKKLWLAAGAVAMASLAVLFYAAPFQGGGQQPLADLAPAGPLLYLEAKDFAAELQAWNSSSEKQTWLASARYQGFQRSTLFQRLEAESQQFTTAAGFAPDAAFVESLAGRESSLAVYDIGSLAFLYITRLPSARAMQSILYQSRAGYETRKAGGIDFFIRVNSGRTVAFAAAGGLLILSDREDLEAGALRLLSGEHLAAVKDEGWYKEAVAAAAAPGDLRLVMNLEALVQSPQFRTYWIQRNASEIRPFWTAVADVHRTGNEIREERVLLRKNATPAVENSAEPLASLAPESAAFFRAWPHPGAAEIASLIEVKLLVPKPTPRRFDEYAPQVNAEAPPAGADSDLETRIDQAPLTESSTVAMDGMRRILDAANLTSAIEIQSGHTLPDGVFVDTPIVLALEAGEGWNLASVRNALTAAMASLWTTGNSGVTWVERNRGAQHWYAVDGLAKLQAAAAGKLIFLANSEDALNAVLERSARPAAASDASSIAVFRHTSARGDYRRMMSLLDYTRTSDASRPTLFIIGGAPFFSSEVMSLSDVFQRVNETTVRRWDRGSALQEVVTYRLR